MRWFWVIFLCGCGYAHQTDDTAFVSVSYSGIGEVVVYTSVGGSRPQRIGQVVSGRPECMRLPRTSLPVVLIARELGSKETHLSPQFFTNTYKFWSWDLHIHLQTSRINLTPSDSCRREE